MQGLRRILGPLAAAVLAIGLGIAIFVSARHAAEERAVALAHGIVGSEKGPFFADPEVQAEFRKQGITLRIDTEGSREQVTSGTKDQADFFFPAGEPAGRALAAKLGAHTVYNPFYTPMLIASWKPIASILMANGIVKQISGHYYVVDMAKLLAASEHGTRWSQLLGNGAYDTNKSILISSTDVRKSNSAAMYMALASYVFNGNNIVATQSQIAHVQTSINGLFLRQGYQESSSAGPFDDYTTIGMGKAPLVMAYEQQFIEYLIAHPPAERPKDMVPLYPKPTIFSKHTLVPTDAVGDKVGTLLQTDPVLITLEIKHGFRNQDTQQMRSIWSSGHVDVPETLIDVIDPPSFETLETMTKNVSDAFSQQ